MRKDIQWRQKIYLRILTNHCGKRSGNLSQSLLINNNVYKTLFTHSAMRFSLFHSGPENLKKLRTKKKLMESNKSISHNFFSIFELGKMQFHEKIFLNYLISWVFFCLDFLNFFWWISEVKRAQGTSILWKTIFNGQKIEEK